MIPVRVVGESQPASQFSVTSDHEPAVDLDIRGEEQLDHRRRANLDGEVERRHAVDRRRRRGRAVRNTR